MPGRPLVFDPFAGGGSIPIEALRCGADAFASDLNPVAVLLNRVALQYVPDHGKNLADLVETWGAWVGTQARKELTAVFPDDANGASPIAYIWARTIRCEGPGCGAEIPLMRSFWLAKKGARRSVALRIRPNHEEKRIEFEVVRGRDAVSKQAAAGTVARGSATCPLCHYTTPVANVREQLRKRRGGTHDARPVAVVTTVPGERGADYRVPSSADAAAIRLAEKMLAAAEQEHSGPLSLVPDEPLPPQGTLGFRVQLYGMTEWGDLFLPRQKLVLSTFTRLIRDAAARVANEHGRDVAEAVATMLAMALGKLVDYQSSLCVWRVVRTCAAHTFGRQALPITWDFGEMNPFAGSAGDWGEACRYLGLLISELSQTGARRGQAIMASATNHPLPSDAGAAFLTDPPYYDAVPYADLSDYFYVWHKRALGAVHPDLFSGHLSPKEDEAVVNPVARSANGQQKDAAYYESQMRAALSEGRRVLAPYGIGVVVFAHKTTAGWEAILQSMIDAGWIATASWPIDTERPGRLRAQASAALSSSIHLVCRPRENPDGSLRTDDVGDWRSILRELPGRIHEWMPRLAKEGIVGADSVFACLGPALEIFSRYSRVEKASGEKVELREYLEQVWAAVAREALSMIFDDADATGLEEDARLSAMWLWTLAAGTNGADAPPSPGEEDDTGDDDEAPSKAKIAGSFSMEYDAARKIAQGLGAHLEDLKKVVEIKGDTARLLGVAERTQFLFGKDASAPTGQRRAAKPKQMSLFAELEAAEQEAGWGDTGAPTAGETTLDRIHQAMVLFAAGRGEALKRFLVEEGVGRDARFWKLAQSLSALYPGGTEEKRWVDGVLARKKGLGF